MQATLSSLPPIPTSKFRAWSSRCIPGGDSRSKVSPSVTKSYPGIAAALPVMFRRRPAGALTRADRRRQ